VLSSGPRNGLSITANDEQLGFPTLSIGAIQSGQVVPTGYTKFAEVDEATVQRFRLERGDVLVVRGNGNRDLTGRCGLVGDVPKGCFYPDLLVKLVFDSTKMRPAFGTLQWNSPFVQRELKRRAKSTNGIWKVNGKDISQQMLRVPPLAEQEQFLDRMDAVRGLQLSAEVRRHDTRNMRLMLLNGLLPAVADV
jgi:type I restriction enzyme S subunit